MRKPFWDVEEIKGFDVIQSNIDSLNYRVWNEGSNEVKQQVADTLAEYRYKINCLLFYLIKNEDLWIDKKIAWGILHTFDIHIPAWKQNLNLIVNSEINKKLSNKINKDSQQIGKLYNMQEMTPNDDGILGLNKPKKIIKIKRINNKGFYEIAGIRSMHLTLRKNNFESLIDKTKIKDLVLHELTHTTCNDIYWKKDNHEYPYEAYHALIKKWAAQSSFF